MAERKWVCGRCWGDGTDRPPRYRIPTKPCPDCKGTGRLTSEQRARIQGVEAFVIGAAPRKPISQIWKSMGGRLARVKA